MTNLELYTPEIVLSRISVPKVKTSERERKNKDFQRFKRTQPKDYITFYLQCFPPNTDTFLTYEIDRHHAHIVVLAVKRPTMHCVYCVYSLATVWMLLHSPLCNICAVFRLKIGM